MLCIKILVNILTKSCRGQNPFGPSSKSLLSSPITYNSYIPKNDLQSVRNNTTCGHLTFDTESIRFDDKNIKNVEKIFYDRDRIRTCNLLIRSQTRYPLRHTVLVVVKPVLPESNLLVDRYEKKSGKKDSRPRQDSNLQSSAP